MKELVSLIVKKTGIPAAIAQTVVNMVVDFLKQKLPAPVAGQIDAVLKNEASAKTAEDVLRNYASRLRKK
jgi:hypothetical protein